MPGLIIQRKERAPQEKMDRGSSEPPWRSNNNSKCRLSPNSDDVCVIWKRVFRVSGSYCSLIELSSIQFSSKWHLSAQESPYSVNPGQQSVFSCFRNAPISTLHGHYMIFNQSMFYFYVCSHQGDIRHTKKKRKKHTHTHAHPFIVFAILRK